MQQRRHFTAHTVRDTRITTPYDIARRDDFTGIGNNAVRAYNTQRASAQRTQRAQRYFAGFIRDEGGR